MTSAVCNIPSDVFDFDSLAPLASFDRYCQTWRRAEIILDLNDGLLSWRTYSPGDGTPMNLWHHCAVSFSVPYNVTGADLLTVITRVRPLFNRILAGAEISFDGRNLVGRLDADATKAEEEAQEIIAGFGYSENEIADAREAVAEFDSATFQRLVTDHLKANATRSDAIQAVVDWVVTTDDRTLVGDVAEAVEKRAKAEGVLP